MIKVEYIDEECIVFDNGKAITYDHEQDCCEHNYADFMSATDTVRYIGFKELSYEFVDGFGFKFGDDQNLIHYCNSVVIPCYSEQNGFYTSEIDIYECDVEWIPDPMTDTYYHKRYNNNHEGYIPKLTNRQKVLSGYCAQQLN